MESLSLKASLTLCNLPLIRGNLWLLCLWSRPRSKLWPITGSLLPTSSMKTVNYASSLHGTTVCLFCSDSCGWMWERRPSSANSINFYKLPTACLPVQEAAIFLHALFHLTRPAWTRREAKPLSTPVSPTSALCCRAPLGETQVQPDFSPTNVCLFSSDIFLDKLLSFSNLNDFQAHNSGHIFTIFD